MTHLVEFICTFRDRSARLKAGNKLLKGFEIHCIGLLYNIAEDDNKSGIKLASTATYVVRSPYGVKGACEN